MSIRRVDVLLFLAGLVFLVVQALTNDGWFAVPFAACLAGWILAPRRWTIGRSRNKTSP